MDISTILAALAASTCAMIVGGLWYSPMLFGIAWQRLLGPSEQPTRSAVVVYCGAFVLILLGALVFAAFLGPEPDLTFALGAGVSAGLAWASGSIWIVYLFENKPLKLGLINGGYLIAQYTLFGLIFGLF